MYLPTIRQRREIDLVPVIRGKGERPSTCYWTEGEREIERDRERERERET